MTAPYPELETLSLESRQASGAEYLAVPPAERKALEATITELQTKHPYSWQQQLTDQELFSAAKLGYPTFEAIEDKLVAYKMALKGTPALAVVQHVEKFADDASILALFNNNQRLLDAARQVANPDLIIMKAAMAFPHEGAGKVVNEMLSPVYTKQGAVPAASPEAIRAAGVFSASVYLLEEAAKRGAPVTTQELALLQKGASLDGPLGKSYQRALNKVVERFEIEVPAATQAKTSAPSKTSKSLER